MKTINTCPACSSSKFEHFLSCKDYTQSHDEFFIVKCSTCQFTFTNPIPEEDKIGSYYESEEYISHSNTSKGIVNQLYQLIRNYTLKKKVALLQSLSNKKTLLDIGCGTGEFLNQAQANGYEVHGIEPSETARKQAISNYGIKVRNEEQIKNFAEQQFSFVSMWHVLEHVYNLNDQIKEIYRILDKEGFLIIAVPNHESFDAKHYQKYWAAYDVPRHLYHFTPKTIAHLFNTHGFDLHQTLPMKFDSFYVSMLSEKYKTGSTNLVKAFYTGLKSNLKANSSQTYSSQIYVFKKTQNKST